jgi:hypothetical protein
MATAIADRIKQQIVLGLKNGGRIPMPMITAEIGWAIDQLFEETEMSLVELTPIVEVVDATEYTLATGITAASARIVRMHSLYRNRPTVNDVRTLLNPQFYRVDNVIADTATPTPVLSLILDDLYPSSSILDTLVPVVVMGFQSEDYIPQMHLSDAEKALTALVKQTFLSQTSKQWGGSPGQALAEFQTYSAAVSRIKHKVLRGSTGSGLIMRTPTRFI